MPHLLDLPKHHIYEFHQNIYVIDCDRMTALTVVVALDPPRFTRVKKAIDDMVAQLLKDILMSWICVTLHLMM